MVKMDKAVEALTNEIVPLVALSRVTDVRLFPLPLRLMPVPEETTKLGADTPLAPP